MSGPVLTSLVVGDDRDSWEAAGFTVGPDDVVAIGSVAIHLVGPDGGRRIRSWAFDAIDPDTLADGALDGLVTRVARRPTPRGAASPHHNGVTQIDHLVLATPDVARTTAAFERSGLRARRVRETESQGAPMTQTFFRSGEVILELVGPHDPSGDGPTGFFGLAHTVDDLDATVAGLGDAIGAPRDAVQAGRRIATLRHRAVGMSVATAFLSPEPAR